MSYSATVPPQCVVPRIGDGGALWYYASTDVDTDVDATDYFSNGAALGMKVNDIVAVVKTTATIKVTWHVVTVVTAGGAATVAAV